jgi:RNA polymerase sigma-70 factor (ECF subfamily)
MATTLAPTTGSTALMRAARIEAHGADWAERDLGEQADSTRPEGEMTFTESAVKQSEQRPGGDERHAVLSRKAVDPDAVLVEALRRADAGAVEALVRTYEDRVYRLAIRITGNASDAEEVVQDALLTASRKIETFRGEAAFGSWVYRITVNAAYQKLRGRRIARNEVSWEDIGPSFDEKGRLQEVAFDWSRRLKDPALEGELKAVLSGSINQLPQDFRTSFLLRDVEGLSNADIAEALQLKVSTVKSRVHRARLFLRKSLADYMGEPRDGRTEHCYSIPASA